MVTCIACEAQVPRDQAYETFDGEYICETCVDFMCDMNSDNEEFFRGNYETLPTQ